MTTKVENDANDYSQRRSEWRDVKAMEGKPFDRSFYQESIKQAYYDGAAKATKRIFDNLNDWLIQNHPSYTHLYGDFRKYINKYDEK